jgi:hypothetical protein
MTVVAVTADATESDAELIGRAVRQPEAFAALFDRHYRRIYAYAARRLGAGIAEDVAAETVPDRVRPAGPLRPGPGRRRALAVRHRRQPDRPARPGRGPAPARPGPQRCGRGDRLRRRRGTRDGEDGIAFTTINAAAGPSAAATGGGRVLPGAGPAFLSDVGARRGEPGRPAGARPRPGAGRLAAGRDAARPEDVPNRLNQGGPHAHGDRPGQLLPRG